MTSTHRDTPPDLRRDLVAAAEELRTASQRLVRTVDALADDDWAVPSLLPDWTRGHVVAHLALNGEGLAGALRGVLEGEPVPMYVSQERRDADIAELGTADPPALRERLLGSVTELADALAALAVQPAEVAETRIDRTEDGARTFRARVVAWMRLREVEIHHVDLGRDYSPGDWPPAFTLALIDEFTRRRADETALRLAPSDVGGTWQVGDAGRAVPTVTGTAAGLAWWLTGRPPYPGLDVTSDAGALPALEGM